MSRIDYSKWDHIEISDDEDDTHPNVDTPSLFKWRHEARVQRKEEEKMRKAKAEAEMKIRGNQIDMMRARKRKLENEGGLEAKEELAELTKQLEKMETEQKEFIEKEAELERLEREHPKWDVDNISQEKHNKTIINKIDDKKGEPKTEEEQASTMAEWFKKNGERAEAYSKLSHPSKSHKYLSENIDLVCDHLANFLVIYCVDLAVDDDHKAVENCARQTVQIQYILELAKSIKRDPRECINSFFARMATAEDAYKAAFDDEVKSLIARVFKRRDERIEEAKAQAAAERKKALKPGELDPVEVLESLPEKIQKAFRDQNTPLLQQGFAELSPEDAKYHYERVVKSGLWVPAAESDEGGDADDEGDDDAGEDDDNDGDAE